MHNLGYRTAVGDETRLKGEQVGVTVGHGHSKTDDNARHKNHGKHNICLYGFVFIIHDNKARQQDCAQREQRFTQKYIVTKKGIKPAEAEHIPRKEAANKGSDVTLAQNMAR